MNNFRPWLEYEILNWISSKEPFFTIECVYDHRILIETILNNNKIDGVTINQEAIRVFDGITGSYKIIYSFTLAK